MSLYYLILKAAGEAVPDREGLEFPDVEAADAHARIVARELMRNREIKTRSWRIAVCDQDLQPCSEVLFATVDDSIAHLQPPFKKAVEGLSRSTATLFDAIERVQTSLCDAKETIARADQMMAQLQRQLLSRKEGRP
jgi:hypothetical protein